MTYILDTNIITAVLKDNERVKEKLMELALKGEEILINAISYYEIKRGFLKIKAATQLKRFDRLCSEYGLVMLNNRNIFEIASKIYADLSSLGKPIGDADILIASIALYNNSTLVTHDSDFDRVEKLTKEDWLN